MALKLHYTYSVPVTTVQIDWQQELVETAEEGNFYVRLRPVVSNASGSATKSGLARQGAMRRNEIAQQSARIFDSIKKGIEKDAQMRLRAEQNKRRGQRWNKKG